MAKRVTEEDIQKMNEIYALCGSLKQTAEATGWSSSTVSKYVDKSYKPTQTAAVPLDFTIEFPSIDETIQSLLNFNELTKPTTEERIALKKIQKRIIF